MSISPSLPPPGQEPRARLVEIDGARIVLADYSNLNAMVDKPKMLATIAAVRELIASDKQPKRILTDGTGAYADGEILAALKEVARFANSNGLVERECVVGLSALQRHLLELVNLFAKAKLVPFKTRKEGVDYLVR